MFCENKFFLKPHLLSRASMLRARKLFDNGIQKKSFQNGIKTINVLFLCFQNISTTYIKLVLAK